MFNVAPLLLYMTAEPFEYPRSDWPAAVRMVGPCCWEPPGEPPAWLDEITRPLVLVTTSSEFQDDGRLVRTALDALADEDVQVVATLPAAKLDIHVPANARVEAFISHGPLLERAVCAVTHGGAGATQKALAAGVPVCVVPFGRDQLEVARRVEVANAGARLPAQKLNAERLRSQVRLAITRRDGARRVAGRLPRERWTPHRSRRVRNPCGGTEHQHAGPDTHPLIDTRVRRHRRSRSMRATSVARDAHGIPVESVAVETARARPRCVSP